MKHKIIIGTILVALVAFGLAGCGSKRPQEVTVTLTEYGIDSSLTTFKAGQPYHFVITNNGEEEHEVMIMQPMEEDANMEMEEMDEMALAMVEEEDLPPGATETLDYTFDQAYPAGTLEFACHVEGHYEAGMLEAIIVEP